MKFVLFNESKLGLLTGNEVVDLTQIIPRELRSDGQNAMVFIINNCVLIFDGRIKIVRWQ